MNTRYLSLFFGFIAVIVVVVIGAVLVRNTFRGGNAPKVETPELTEEVTGNTTLRMRLDGPVVANENRESIQIDVSPRQRTIAYFKTYTDIAERRGTYPNNDKAFEEFVKALAIAGFATENTKFTEPHNGECASGRVYHFDLIEDGQTKRSLWTNSCDQRVGNFAGNAPAVIRLFRVQIPNFEEIVLGSTLQLPQ